MRSDKKAQSIHRKKYNSISKAIFNHCILFYLILTFNFSFGQQNAKNDYIVTITGDTIIGTFTRNKWNNTPRQIEFNGPDGIKNYKPIELKSFFVGGEMYESGIVNIDQSPQGVQSLDYSPNPVFKLDTIFLEVIFRSSKSLLYYKSKEGKSLFFYKDELKPIEALIYKKYLVDRRLSTLTNTYIIENRFYVSQLKLLFSQCLELSNDIDKAKYDMHDLKALFAKGTECLGEKVSFRENQKRIRSEFQIIVGIDKPTLQFSSNLTAFSQFTNGNFNTSLSPNLGAGVNFKSLRRDNLSVSIFILYSNLKAVGDAYRSFDNRQSNFEFQYNCFGSNLNFGLRPIRKIPLYLALGGSFNIISEVTANWTEQYSTSNIIQREFSSSKSSLGLIASVNYQIKLEFMYYKGNGISSYNNMNSTINRFHLLFKYSLSRSEK